MTGAGFGGCTVNLVRPDAVDALRAAVEREYPARTGRQPRVLAVDAVVAPARRRSRIGGSLECATSRQGGSRG